MRLCAGSSVQATVDSVIDGRSSCAPPASAPAQGTIMLHILHRLAWVLGVLALAGPAAVDQGYPTRIVTVVVATPPGGQPDILARLIADRLSRAFPYRFIVENRVGANGNLAPAHVAKQAPDGHTLFVGSAPFLINPSLYGDLSFDVFRISSRSHFSAQLRPRSSSIPAFRQRPWRSSSSTCARTRASRGMPLPARQPPAGSRSSCSSVRPISMWRSCPTGGPVRSSTTCSPATCR